MNAKQAWTKTSGAKFSSRDYCMRVIKANSIPDDCLWCRLWIVKGEDYVCYFGKDLHNCNIYDFTKYLLENL